LCILLYLTQQLSDMVCGYVRQLFIEDKARDVTLEVSDVLSSSLNIDVQKY